jgi:putative transposase
VAAGPLSANRLKSQHSDSGTARALVRAMTAPRQILPNATYLITRRCFSRMFLLRPSAVVNDIFEYVLASKAEKYGIQLHAYCVLSNHWHCVLTDPLGNLPAFQRDLGSTVARALNAELGRWESFWAPGSYSAVTLQTADDVLDKMAYVLANPVAAGLVRRGADWPGLWSAPSDIGGSVRVVARPDQYFRKRGPTPPSARLELTCPEGFDSPAELRERLSEELARREKLAARDLAAAGRIFLGAEKALAQKPFARPATSEPRRGLRPRLASRDKWKRIEAIGRLKGFLVEYRRAWRAFASGMRSVVFPEGTYWMRVACGVACASSA